MRKFGVVLLCSLMLAAGCSVNPVTGKYDLILTSTAQDIATGQQNYAPMQQAQGGIYDIDPALTAYVSRVGQAVAAQSTVDLPYQFVIINSSVPNAWALPGGKIAINRGLLTALQSESELAAVLGHEVVHAAARHTAQQQSRAVLAQVGVMGTAIASSNSDYGNMIVGGTSLLAQAGLAKYGRSAELESDYYGMEYMSAAGYDPQGAVRLQETFVKLSEGRNQDWISGLFASHPPSGERVKANISTAATLPQGGIVGAEGYKAAIQRTLELEPAYETYDKGRKALAADDTAEALQQAEKALGMFNGEANFHALRGDVRLVQKKYDDAVTNYDRAVGLRGDFFYYYLQRGMARNELGQYDAAAADLEKSIEMLPTAPAYYTLGKIAEARGNRAEAIDYYKVVADSGGDYGTAAKAALVRLDLSANPGTYIPRRCDADNAGNLTVSIRNDTQVALRGIVIAVQMTDAYGRAQQRRFDVRGELPPGRVATVSTGLGPFTPGASCPAEVVAAEIAE